MFSATTELQGAIYGDRRINASGNAVLAAFLPMETFGGRLKLFAQKVYGSQKAFAAAIGMHEGQLSDYVKDRVEPSLAVLQKFRQAGVSLDWLATGEGEMTGAPPTAPPTDPALERYQRVRADLAALFEEFERSKAERADEERGEKEGGGDDEAGAVGAERT